MKVKVEVGNITFNTKTTLEGALLPKVEIVSDKIQTIGTQVGNEFCDKIGREIAKRVRKAMRKAVR